MLTFVPQQQTSVSTFTFIIQSIAFEQYMTIDQSNSLNLLKGLVSRSS